MFLNVESILKAIKPAIDNNESLIDAIAEYCIKNDIEIEAAADLLKKDPNVIRKLSEEAIKYNLIKGEIEMGLDEFFV